MSAWSMQLWQARLMHAAVRLGPAGVAGLALLTASVTAIAVGVPLLRQEAASLEREVAEGRQQLVQRREAAVAPAISADPVTALLQQLPSVEAAPAFMGSIYQAAARQGLQIERAEYRWTATVAGRVQRYQVILPVRGTYGSLRPWLDQVLHEFPNVALDEVTVRRESEGAATIEARVALSFYGRGRS